MKNIFITGVSGYIGGKIARALGQRKDVRSITGIDIREPDFTCDRFIFIKRDVRQSVQDILEAHKTDTVIHAAYVLPPGHNVRLMEDINISGTLNILECSKKAGVKRLLYTSSTTAYGFYPDNDFPLTEDSPLRGNSDFTYCKNKKEIEAIFKDFTVQNPEICVTILRPCYVAGPGLDNPLSTHLKKHFVMLPRQNSPFQFVHEDDLIRIMLLCLEKNQAGIFNVGGEGTISFDEMVRMLGNRPLFLPDIVVRIFNGLAWHLRLKFLTEFPNAGLNLIQYPWIASSQKLLDETGYQFEYDTKGAFEDFAKHVLSK